VDLEQKAQEEKRTEKVAHGLQKKNIDNIREYYQHDPFPTNRL
jgi:hypothetical protein